jgi:hypothetical protein
MLRGRPRRRAAGWSAPQQHGDGWLALESHLPCERAMRRRLWPPGRACRDDSAACAPSAAATASLARRQAAVRNDGSTAVRNPRAHSTDGDSD